MDRGPRLLARALRLRPSDPKCGRRLAWLARVDLADVSLGLGQALEAQARRAASRRGRTPGAKPRRSTTRPPIAVALDAEKHLVGQRRLLGELREGRARCEKALAACASRS